MSTEKKAIVNISTKAAFPSYYGEHAFGEHFEHNGSKYVVVTPEQAESFERVIERQGAKALKEIHCWSFDPALILSFDHITIGIEPDGYAHS